MARALIIEDEDNLRLSMQRALTRSGHVVSVASCLRDARELIQQQNFEIVLTDVMLGSENGIEFVRELRREGYDGVVVIITAFGTVESAVGAMRDGADNYLQKPLSMQDLQMQVDRSLSHQMTTRRLKIYERLEQSRELMHEVVGESEPWKRTLTFASKLAQLPIEPDASANGGAPALGISSTTGSLPTALLLGETGVGKGVLARFIHSQATRRNKTERKSGNGSAGEVDTAPPFVHVNCSALPASLVEAELFGHEKGAFTDAGDSRPGLFEMADGGTIFLDEISEMPIELQAKLLLVVEQGIFRRVGGTKERRVRTRIIAASNQDLEERAKEGQFRRDLLYRLNTFTVRIPPLRERGDDSVLIAKTALDALSRRYGKPPMVLSAEAERAVRQHVWPGNVRELMNAVQRGVMLSEGQSVEAFDLGLANPPESVQNRSTGPSDALVFNFENGIHTLEQVEKALVMQALQHTKGNVSRAARLIGLQRSSLRYRIEQFGLEQYVTEVGKQ